MTTNPSIPTIRLSTPHDLIATIPYLLGFQPEESTIVLLHRGRRLVLTARVDLPGTTQLPHQLRDHLTADTTVVVVIYSHDPDAAHAAAQTLLQAIPALPIGELVLTDTHRYWTPLCTNPACCPPDGTPLADTVTAAQAELIYTGRNPATSRTQLAERLNPPTGPASEQYEAAYRQALTELPHRRVDRTRLALDLTRRHAHPETPLPNDDTTALLAALLTDLDTRDAVWALHTDPDTAEGYVRLWHHIATHTDPQATAAPLALHGFANALTGDGANLNVTIETLRARHPDYTLTDILETIATQAIPPTTCAHLIDGLADLTHP